MITQVSSPMAAAAPSTLALTDTHCHLDFPDFAEDLTGVVARAEAADVRRMITISTRVARAAHYQAIAEQFANVWFSIGTHPHQAAEEQHITLDDLLAVAAHKKCVAIGEAGLDFHYNLSPPDVQAASLRLHIAAARQTGLPLVIHARAADEAMITLLEEEHAKGAFGAVLHCFSSSAALAECGLRLGFYLSFSGILTFKNAIEIQKVAAAAPLDRLLVETDAPYLAPVPHRGARNEPSFTRHTAQKLADLRGISLAALAPHLEANTERLFAKIVGG